MCVIFRNFTVSVYGFVEASILYEKTTYNAKPSQNFSMQRFIVEVKAMSCVLVSPLNIRDGPNQESDLYRKTFPGSKSFRTGSGLGTL